MNNRPENQLKNELDLDALARGKPKFRWHTQPADQIRIRISLNFSSASACVNTGLFGFFVIGSLVQYLLDILLCGRL